MSKASLLRSGNVTAASRQSGASGASPAGKEGAMAEVGGDVEGKSILVEYRVDKFPHDSLLYLLKMAVFLTQEPLD